jgi:hypothetical protein
MGKRIIVNLICPKTAVWKSLQDCLVKIKSCNKEADIKNDILRESSPHGYLLFPIFLLTVQPAV